jgi:hypothetical protein
VLQRIKICKDQLLISAEILQKWKAEWKICVWHVLIIRKLLTGCHTDKFLELIGINNKIISFTKKFMSYWRISMCLHTETKLIEREYIEIQCGIFQGDSLSPLQICISLIPFTEQLNSLNTGYKEHTTKTKISHLLYMDDLKSWSVNQGKSTKNRYKQLKLSVMISIWNLDFTNVER